MRVYVDLVNRSLKEKKNDTHGKLDFRVFFFYILYFFPHRSNIVFFTIVREKRFQHSWVHTILTRAFPLLYRKTRTCRRIKEKKNIEKT